MVAAKVYAFLRGFSPDLSKWSLTPVSALAEFEKADATAAARARCRPRATLENFSAGKTARALQALREAREDGERFVFLWGPVGQRQDATFCALFPRGGVGRELEAAAVDDVARPRLRGADRSVDLCNRLRGSVERSVVRERAGRRPRQLGLRADLRTRLASELCSTCAP